MEHGNNSKEADNPVETPSILPALEPSNKKVEENALQSHSSESINRGFSESLLLEQNHKEAEETVVKSLSPKTNNNRSSNSSALEQSNNKAEETALQSHSSKSNNKGSSDLPVIEQSNNEGEETAVKSHSSEMNNNGSSNSPALEQSNNEAEDAAMKSHLSETNNRESENASERPNKAESSRKGNPKSLKARSKIKKGPAGSISLKAEKANQEVPGENKKRKSKITSKGKRENNKKELKNDNNQGTREDKLQQNLDNKEHTGKDHGDGKKQESIAGSSQSLYDRKSKEKNDGREKSSRHQKHKESKPGVKEKSHGDQKLKEKIGGLIFMCNAKTKPDCFRYQVMGMTPKNKDLVLGVKPGLKLFLYDFDMRLMYGIYRASSSGGMRLEPKAFGGSFPVQVRFSVHKDCNPIPESVFKKAIKDNYDSNNKFDIQLTVRQVRKLHELFRPSTFHSVKPAAVPVHSVHLTNVTDREVFDRLREPPSHSDRETISRSNGRSYPVHSHGRDQHIEHRQAASKHREEPSRDLFMTEMQYRAYGLQRNRRNLTPPCGASSTLDPYPKNLDRDHLLRQPYRDAVPVHREPVLADTRYSSERESKIYNRGRSDLLTVAPSVSAVPSSLAVPGLDSYRRDPYHSYQYGALSTSLYMPPPEREGKIYMPPPEREGKIYMPPPEREGEIYMPRKRERETHLVGSDPLHQSEPDPLDELYSDPLDKLYLKYGVQPLSDYKPLYQGSEPETVPPPVSARYSFAGPSASYR